MLNRLMKKFPRTLNKIAVARVSHPNIAFS
jgi:hypothetical protein